METTSLSSIVRDSDGQLKMSEIYSDLPYGSFTI